MTVDRIIGGIILLFVLGATLKMVIRIAYHKGRMSAFQQIENEMKRGGPDA